MQIEVAQIKLGEGNPQAVLKAWHQAKAGFTFKNTKKLDAQAKLSAATGNIIYEGYVIEKIAKPIRGPGYVTFTNGVTLYEGVQAKPLSAIFSEQLYWLIDSHFHKKKKLEARGIKCLSLVFIDRVANYIQPDGIIRQVFIEQYKKVYKEHYDKEPTFEQVSQCQGSYFAKTGKGDYTDNERSMYSNKELFDLILRDKEQLLSLGHPVEFIFSHSALGVGWDNPNVFNIATLNQSYSELKKRQEIGRGLRICVNQEGERVYDSPNTAAGEEINLLTVIPNETYETFVQQYQSEIEEVYGTDKAASELRHTHKGEKRTERRISRNEQHFKSSSFRAFWKKVAQKTDYKVSFNDDSELIRKSVEVINEIRSKASLIEVELRKIKSITEDQGIEASDPGRETKKSTATFAPIDLIEEIEDKTGLARPTAVKIVEGINNRAEITKNPPLFLQEAIRIIQNTQLDEMIRALDYSTTGEHFELDEFQQHIISHTDRIVETPTRGLYDHVVWDSEIERAFAEKADVDAEVVCFLKLPAFYKIETPVGTYNPDFGLVLKRRKIRDDASAYYFVVETKGTNDINDRKTLTRDEIYKIKCAMKHFKALGVEAKYRAPVKEYTKFKEKIDD